LSVCIAGIGLNLNQRVFHSDAPNPTSLVIELESISGNAPATSSHTFRTPDGNLDPRQELVTLLQKIAELYIPLTEEGSLLSDPIKKSFPALLEERYLSVLYRLNELHTYTDLTTGETFRGYIRGIEKNACLRIETETGAIKSFAFKELKYIISQ
jgi:BirA family biotin operon repressor/biotin-[acetyl-CoA-carboxylase] ligase